MTSGCLSTVGSACDTVVEVGGAGLVGGCSFEGNQQLWELAVALDAAELGLGSRHPRGGPAQFHVAVLPALDPAGMMAVALDYRLDRVGGLQGLEQ